MRRLLQLTQLAPETIEQLVGTPSTVLEKVMRRAWPTAGADELRRIDSQFLSNKMREGSLGVGKTSISCATSIKLAREGRRVLLVSTDPASNVGQVFHVVIGNRITPITVAPGLSELEIDPADRRSRLSGSHRRSCPGSPAYQRGGVD